MKTMGLSRTWVMLLLVSLCSCSTCLAVVRYVSPSGSGNHPYTNWLDASPSIRAAVEACSPGDTVIVTNGLYQDEISVVISNAITLSSVNGCSNTVLDHMSYAGRVLTALADGTRINGFTLMRGIHANGGGVYLGSGATLSDCLVVSNTGNRGGGIFAEPGSVVSNCIVRANSASGSGSYYQGGGLYCQTAVVIRCTIEENSAYYGAGVCMDGGLLQASHIRSNRAFWSSGSQGRGGGIFFLGGTAENCRVEGNLLFGATKQGGGVYFNGGGVLRNALVQGHTNANDGGGIYCQAGGLVENCTVVSNRAASYGAGGGVYMNNGGLLQNTIVWSNQAGSASDIAIVGEGQVIDHSCAPYLVYENGNLTDYPEFLNPEAGDYRLGALSPCRNAGSNAVWMSGANDLQGLPRILDSVVDMGAYETPFSVDFLASPRRGLIPLDTVFTAGVTGDASTIFFQWDYDDDGNWDAEGVGLSAVTTRYEAVGYYTVRAAISNAVAQTATEVKTSYIHAAAIDLYASPAGSHNPPFTNWSSAATNIQSAINEGEDGTTIWLADGPYQLGGQLVLEKAVTLRGLNPAPASVIHAGGSQRGLEIKHAGATVRDVAIRRGYATSPYHGGGIYAPVGGMIFNCLIQSNWTANHGGGIYMGPGTHVSNCVIAANRCQGSGIGVFCEGGLVEDSVVSNNLANGPDGYYGGGIYAGNATVLRTRISGNRSYNRGGGVYAGGSTIVRDCLIDGNANAVFYGGGAAIQSGAQLLDSTVSGNAGAWGGGGVVLEGGSVSGCLITGNRADMGAGGVEIWSGEISRSVISSSRWHGIITWENAGPVRNCLITHNQGSGVSDWGRLVLENCTVTRNEKGLSLSGYYPAEIRNSICYGNTDYPWNNLEISRSVLVEYSCVRPLVEGAGNTDADPEFVDAAAGDFRLRPGSPCENAGIYQDWMAGAMDLVGQSRVQGIAVDLGAHEATPAGLAANVMTETRVAPGSRDVVLDAFVRGTNIAGLYYAWDLDGDGLADAEGYGLDSVTQSFAAIGYHSIGLTVSNDAGEVFVVVRTNYIGIGPVTCYVARSGAHIPPFTSWANAATTIQAAVDAGLDGTVVAVSNRVWSLGAPLIVSNGVLVRSFGPTGTSAIVQGDDTFRVIEIRHDQAVLDGLTIRRGYADNGGGVYAPAGVVRNCLVESNTATAAGGGVYLTGYGRLTGSLVRANTGQYGGGVFGQKSARVDHCTVVSNTANGGHGGGINIQQGSAVRHTTIKHNESIGNFGGGLAMDGSTLAENCLIASNACGVMNRGGGVYAGYSMIRNCRITGNRAPSGNSGGVYAYDSVVLENCLVDGNSADYAGGGMTIQSSIELRHCVVVGNSASNSGGGLEIMGNNWIRNSIVKDNNAPVGANWQLVSGPFLCQYSCIDPDPGDAGNITDAPLFVNAAGGDYRLMSNSPCLDAGTGDLQISDHDGVVRPLDGNNDGVSAPDMGAYEFVHTLADSDGDGMPDSYEIAYLGLNAAGNDAEMDLDGDHFINLYEYLAGTDPMAGGSSLGFEGTSYSAGQGNVVTWQSVDGKFYRVDRLANLMAGQWTAVATNVLGIAPTNTVIDNTATGTGPWIYRIGLE